MSAGAASTRGWWGRTTPADSSPPLVLVRRGAAWLQGSMIRQSHLPGVYLCAHCPAHHLGARTVYACCLICHALGSSSTHRKDMKHVTIISRRQNLYYCLMEEERATTERVRTWPGDGLLIASHLHLMPLSAIFVSDLQPLFSAPLTYLIPLPAGNWLKLIRTWRVWTWPGDGLLIASRLHLMPLSAIFVSDLQPLFSAPLTYLIPLPAGNWWDLLERDGCEPGQAMVFLLLHVCI
jgi:hypothetical protein